MSDKGIEKEIIKEGNGVMPTMGEQVTVHCTGYGKENDLQKKFWSTRDPGQEPFVFTIGMGQVIPAWDLGVMTMQQGEVAVITSKPENAYGSDGFPAWGILPNSTLKLCGARLPPPPAVPLRAPAATGVQSTDGVCVRRSEIEVLKC